MDASNRPDPPLSMPELPPPPPKRRHVWPWALLVVLVVVVAIPLIRAAVGADPDKASPAGIPKPTGVRAETGAFQVELSWDTSEHPDVYGYRVYLGSESVGAVRGTRFVDVGLLPAHEYTYAVRAFSSGGQSEPTFIRVTTRKAPKASARVDGLFSVAFSKGSHRGFASFQSQSGSEWMLSPVCDSGPCRVVWRSFDYPGVRVTLLRNRGSYHGVYFGDLGIGRGNSTPISVLTVRTRVTEANVLDEQWAATALHGSLVVQTRPQFGCVGSRVSYSIDATLLPPSAASVVLVQNNACGSEGTGFIADRGYVVTNAHIVAGDHAPVIVEGGKPLRGTVVAFDARSDLAVLHVKGLTDAPLLLATSDIVRGTTADMMGFSETYLTLREATILRRRSIGFSIYDKPVFVDSLNVRAHVRHGNSGGPLVLPDGTVAGVIVRTNGHNFGIAIATSEVAAVLRGAERSSRPAPTGSCLPV
jgi:Trypsin-like peptidase domain